MSDKTFTAVGVVTRKNGVDGVRVANDSVSQTKRFHKQNRGTVIYHDLPRAMTKLDAIAHAITMPEFADYKLLLEDTFTNLSGRKAKATGEKKVKAPKQAKAKASKVRKEIAELAD